MQWSDEVNAGFNSKTNLTWLPVHPDYKHVNVEVEQNSAHTDTTSSSAAPILASPSPVGAEER